MMEGDCHRGEQKREKCGNFPSDKRRVRARKATIVIKRMSLGQEKEMGGGNLPNMDKRLAENVNKTVKPW